MCGGLIVSVPDSGVSGLGLNPGRGHCVVFLGKTLACISRSAPQLSPTHEFKINGYWQIVGET